MWKMATFSKNMWRHHRYLVNKHRCTFTVKALSTLRPSRGILRSDSVLQNTYDVNNIDPPQQIRHMSDGGRRNFLQQFFENLKQEMDKDKRMKDSITKFREEAEKLEKSDSLQSARRRYEEFEKETSTGIKQTFDDVSEKLKEHLDEIKKSELAKKGIEFSEEISKSARGAAESVSKTTDTIVKSGAFQAVSKSIQAVKDEIDETTDAGIYRAPEKLRKRNETNLNCDSTAKPIEPNSEALGIELHKDSKWFQQWESFKENNPVVNRVFDWKMKYDESDNVVIRATRFITDKVSDVMGGMFAKTEMSEVLTEIVKIDSSFTKEGFLQRCEKEIIPNVLEAMIRGDLEILKDWCHEAPYNILATPIKQAKKMGYTFHSKVLDIVNVDLLMGKMMEQGPVLIINFQAQQIMVVRNSTGELVEGTENDVQRVNYVWVLCRDQSIFDPNAAWKLMDMSAQSTKQFI